ncbi:MAG: hypothetical protein MN733_32480, partial [Nitrososphaera sp.]|nr:hypothetical protein [Nitrososphaera sp.]
MFNGGVALMGFSQGGGVVRNLIQEELDPINNPQYLPIFGVYLDAVRHDLAFAETRWPEAVFYLLNIYQEVPFQLGGGDINDNEVIPPAVLEEINTTTDPGWNPNLDHSSIDDNLQIQQRILL